MVVDAQRMHALAILASRARVFGFDRDLDGPQGSGGSGETAMVATPLFEKLTPTSAAVPTARTSPTTAPAGSRTGFQFLF